MLLIRNNTFDEILNDLLNVILSLEVTEEQQLKNQWKIQISIKSCLIKDKVIGVNLFTLKYLMLMINVSYIYTKFYLLWVLPGPPLLSHGGYSLRNPLMMVFFAPLFLRVRLTPRPAIVIACY